jgi:hypothetical protein
MFGVAVEYADDYGTVLSGDSLMAQVTCPDNGLVLSAGFSTFLVTGSPGDLVVVESIRINYSSWMVTAVNQSASSIDAALLVSGTCADLGESNTPE